jgi:beta-N-acetylhexosaminidase
VARGLPLDVKLGQLLLLGFVGTQPDAGLLDRARRGRVGGFFLLQRNVRDAAQVRDLTTQLTQASAATSAGISPFLATDFEGGTVNALRAITGATPSAAALGAGGPAAVEARGAQDAALLKSLGLNVNLAPVADVLTSRSEVIGSRAFSADPATVATLSRAYLRGLRRGNVLGVLKHFPGHGGTEGDSHVLLPRVDRTLAQLEAGDLVPYQQAIAAGEAQAVMMGHLLVPAVDQEAPASVSAPAVAGLLRDRLRFDGLVMTDELKMGAISGRYAPPQAAVMAVRAGVDVILADYTAAEQEAVLQALARACQAGQIPEGRLEQSVARVLRLKLAYGLAGPEASARYQALLGAAGAPAGGRPATPGAPAPAARPVDLGGRAIPPDSPLGAAAGASAGRLYVEGAGNGDAGYAVLNAGGIALWDGYTAGGGPAGLGYPISQRFELGGAVVQATQGGLLRWDAERGQASPANVLELFERAGVLQGWPGCESPPEDGAGEGCDLNAWLEQRGVPAPITEDGSDGDFRRAVAARLGWLEHPALRAAFLADPAGGRAAPWPSDEALQSGLEGVPDTQVPWAAIERFGLPMSRPVRSGPFLAQRFQRVVLQLWLDEVPGMPVPGTVTRVLAGELLREAGLIPAPALIPVGLDGAPGVAPALPPPPGPTGPFTETPSAPAEPPPGAPTPVPTPAPTAPARPTPTTTSAQPTPTRQATPAAATASPSATRRP